MQNNDSLLDHYHATVATAIEINMKELRKKSEKAFELIAFASFLYHKNISEDLLLKHFDMNVLEMNEAISILQSYFLLSLEDKGDNKKKENLYSMHEIYQLVISNLLNEVEAKKYSADAAKYLNSLIPTQLDRSIPMFINNIYLMQHLDAICDHVNLYNIINDDVIALYIRKLEYFLPEKRDPQTSLLLIDKINSLLSTKRDAASVMTQMRFKLMKGAYFAWFAADYDASFKEAIEVLEFLKLYPEAQEEHLMVYNRFAQTNMLMGDFEEALKYSNLGMNVVENAKGFLGNQDAFYGIRARIFEDMGELDEALINIKLGLAKAQEVEATEGNSSITVPIIDSSGFIAC